MLVMGSLFVRGPLYKQVVNACKNRGNKKGPAYIIEGDSQQKINKEGTHTNPCVYDDSRI